MRAAIGIAVMLAIGCGDEGGFGEPRQHLPRSADPSFTLYVSNQSFAIDPVDIIVELDGMRAVTGDFEVGSQHSWFEFEFELPAGTHTLRAVTVAGDAVLAESFSLPDDPYGVLDFWFYPPGDGPEPTPRQFSLYLLDEPPLFE